MAERVFHRAKRDIADSVRDLEGVAGSIVEVVDQSIESITDAAAAPASSGRLGVWLATHPHNVTAVELAGGNLSGAEEALLRARRLAAQAAVDQVEFESREAVADRASKDSTEHWKGLGAKVDEIIAAGLATTSAVTGTLDAEAALLSARRAAKAADEAAAAAEVATRAAAGDQEERIRAKAAAKVALEVARAMAKDVNVTIAKSSAAADLLSKEIKAAKAYISS